MQTTATGTYASSNPFRFSSEYYDTETGLVYYNYRYYDAKLGRWLSKDPIGENGGVSLYTIVNNNYIIKYDKMGLKKKNGCCGRDVTKAMDKLLANVRRKMRLEILVSLSYTDPGDGWDIMEMYKKDKKVYGETTGDSCDQTVSYRGKCYKMTVLNYMLWKEIVLIRDQIYRFAIFSLDEKIKNEVFLYSYTRIWKPVSKWIIAWDEPKLKPYLEPDENEIKKYHMGSVLFPNELGAQQDDCAVCNDEYNGELNAVIKIVPFLYKTVNSSGTTWYSSTR